ncbi:MAG: ankyrin repeat domain-containing protein [Ignavibacteriales bacterium]|nr:ankyrin repeat domain-containing protein [Ignavibacteriales bacterium]
MKRKISYLFTAFILITFYYCGNNNDSGKIEPPNLDLHSAIYMRDLEAIKQHIKAGSDINVQENFLKSTPLITAAALDEPEAAKLLIDAGAKIDYQNMDGSTALITAAALGKTNTAKVLIDAGADLNIQNNEGSTALITAAFLCNTEIVKALLEKGADKTILNKRGSTAYDGVKSSFEDVKPIYDVINEGFKKLGIELDYEHIKNTRPLIAEMLK